MADLATTLNEMLRRLKEEFDRLSEFSSDLAHELRTPINNLMTQTQVTLSQPRSCGEYQDILASNAEEYQRLARMVADMLFLAKADHGLILPSTERIAAHDEAQALFDFYEVGLWQDLVFDVFPQYEQCWQAPHHRCMTPWPPSLTAGRQIPAAPTTPGSCGISGSKTSAPFAEALRKWWRTSERERLATPTEDPR